MVNQEFVKSIASGVAEGLFEGGAGSGNWGHKGRPGKRGGSLPGGGGGGGGGGGKTTGKGWGELPKARAMSSNEKKFWERFRKERERGGSLPGGGGGGGGSVRTYDWKGVPTDPKGRREYYKKLDKKMKKMGVDYIVRGSSYKVDAGKGGVSAHKVTVGGQRIHAKNFYTAMGKLDTANYRKLSDANKTQILKHGLQKYSELYIPKANQGKLSAERLEINKKVGALEGMRRAALSKTKGLKVGSKEWRAATHVAISLQERASTLYHFSGSKQKSSGVSPHITKWNEFFSISTGRLPKASRERNRSAGKLATKILRKSGVSSEDLRFAKDIRRTVRNNYTVSKDRYEKLKKIAR